MSTDPTLREEQSAHSEARRCARAMRERLATTKLTAGDEHAEEALRALTERRLAALADDGATPLFFARIDYAVATEFGSTFRIGRQHLHDEERETVAVDWRSPIARPFYRATARAPLGLARRRRFGFADGEVASYETEDLESGTGEDVAERALRREIERPRVGPMRDIVATIQPEQDDLIRARLDRSLCIQGSPGTGKTAVGLHRAAYLLYEHRETLAQTGVLFVGPNRAFMRYVGRILPGLGEQQVTQTTLDDLVAHVGLTGTDEPEVARLKSDPVMGQVIERAVLSRIVWPEEPVVARFRGRRLVIGGPELQDMLRTVLAKGVTYQNARQQFNEMVHRQFVKLAEHRGVAAGHSEREVAKAVRQSEDVQGLLKRTWPKLDAVTVAWDLLSDPEHLAACADGLLHEEAQRQLPWTRKPRSRKRAPWSRADLYLIDEAAGRIARPRAYGHIIVDEAQDLSPMMLRALGRRCQRGSVTLLGDLAQATAPWALESWDQALRHIDKPDGDLIHLPRAFRAPSSVLDFANGLLPLIGVDVTAPTSVRDVPDALHTLPTTGAGLPATTVEAVREALAGEGSIGVITPASLTTAVGEALAQDGIDAAPPDEVASGVRVVLVPATAAKGLEFDQVLVIEPTAFVDDDPVGLRWLYIALTRAVQRLTIVHSRALPVAADDAALPLSVTA